MSGHEQYWEEQAAGYALDALEPDEAAEFLRHLADCADCRARVDQHALVAAQLGALAYDDRPAPTWSELRGGIVGTADEPQSNVVPLRRHRACAILTAAAAAAVAIVVAVVVWPGSSQSHELSALKSVSACQRTSGCHVVQLEGGSSSASVLVYRQAVTVYSDSMARPPAGEEWVLWQLPKQGAPKPLAAYADSNGAQAALIASYADTAGFAISREPAGTMPTKPSTVIVSGTVA